MKGGKHKFFLVLLFLLGGLFFVAPAFAQDIGSQINQGLNYATVAGLGTRDIREVIFLIINVILGFLSIIAVILILYSGFVWMTAGGAEDKIQNAKRILINAVIGLVIIVASFAIAAFISRMLADITGSGTGIPGGGQPEKKSGKEGLNYCIIKNIKPSQKQKIYNLAVRIEFNRNIDGEQVFDSQNIQIIKKDTNEKVKGSYKALGKIIEFLPEKNCGLEAPNKKCFEKDTEYRIVIPDKSLVCGGAILNCQYTPLNDEINFGCSAEFISGNILDLKNPELKDLQGQVCEKNAKIEVSVKDDSEVNVVELFVLKDKVSEKFGAFGKDNIFEAVEFDSWNPEQYALPKGTNVALRAQAFDADTNSSDISKDFIVAPAHCCNGVKDPEEEDTDCGGSCSVACPVIPGGTGPIIVDFDPKQGPLGTYVTISGFRFGKSKGQVEFNDTQGTFDFPFACAVDQGYWTDSRIIVKVPAIGGQIQVIRADNKKSNILQDQFVVQGNPKPGICKISPDNGIPEVTQPKMYGERLSNIVSAVFSKNKNASIEKSGVEKSPDKKSSTEYVEAKVPKEAESGDIYVKSAVDESNKLFFKVGACTANSCSAGQECCSAGPFAKSCMMKGECGATQTRSSYRWSFVTGAPGPRVKDSCTRTNQCSKGGYSSPTPLFDRDGDVPINAAISALFTEPMQQGTLNINTIHIRECNEVNEKQKEFKQSDCKDITEVTGLKFIDGGFNKIEGFVYNPPSFLKPNHWYEVVLDADKILSEKGEELQGNISDARYAWQFKTRADSALAGKGCIDCKPDTARIVKKDNTQDYTGSVYSKNQACVQLNADSYNWQWTSSDSQKATVSGVGPNDARATAIADSGKNPVDIKAEIKGFENNHAICKLFIDLKTPYVTEYWPNCGSVVCGNAEAGAIFSVVLDAHTIKADTVQLYWCGADYECKNLKDNNLISLNGPTYDDKNKKITFTPSSSYFDGKFIPGAYYRAVLKGGKDGIASAEGKLLGALNFDHPENEGLSGLDSFSWTFKVSDNPALCKVNRVAVEPAQAFVPVDGIERYFAQPYSSADRCSNTGQRLNPYLYDWAWESKNAAIAELISPLIDACGNGIIEPGEECDDRNIDNNDLCSYPTCLNKGTTAVADKGTCGNKRKDLGEDCDPPGEFCSDICLNKGNTNDPTTVVCGNGKIETGEECDDRNNRDGDGCNKFCIAEGSVAGVSVCGDGIVGKGEACESCTSEKITSGSCPDSDFARNITTPVGGDGCSARCATEPEPKGITTQAPYPVCGNKVIDIGEEQDIGLLSIADKCLVTGSLYQKDTFKPGPYQWARAKGKVHDKTEIEAEASQKKGFGEFIIVGKSSLFQIISHQPTGANNCQNQFALARFNAPIDLQSLINKVNVEQRNAKSNDAWEFYAKNGKPIYSVELNIKQDIVKISPENGKWEAGKEFQITFLPDIKKDKSEKSLDCSNKLCQWSFSVGNFLCEVARVDVTPLSASVAPAGDATYEAEALGKYKEPSLDKADKVKISGRLSCDTNATVCLTSKGDGAFSINAYEKETTCNSPEKKELPQLKTEGVIQKGVLFLGCGIGAEFGTDTKKWPIKDASFSFDFLKGFEPVITDISFDWTHQELTDDFGNPAIEKSENIDSNSQKFIAAFFDITKDPLRHARVKASISDHAAIFDTAEFFVGNICRDRYGSGDLYGVYPLKTESDTLLLIHFDDTFKAETRARGIDPLVSKNLSFISGLTDGANTLGKSVKFDSSAELSYPAKGNIDPQKGSISLWLNTASLDSAEILRIDGKNSSMVLSIQNNGKVDFSYGNDGIISLKSMSINTWHNLVALWESELKKEAQAGAPAEYLIKLKLYVDNELFAEGEISDAQILELDDANKIHIGSHEGKLIFDGSFDELEIRSRLLSEENIRKRFTAQVSCLGKAEGGEFQVVKTGPAGEICMNPQVFAVFNVDVDANSLKKNVVMCEGDNCAIGDKNVIEDLSYNVPSKTMSIKKPSILKPGTTYNIHLRGGLDGVKSKDGKFLAQDTSWQFTTTNTLCSCDRAKILGHENNGSDILPTPIPLAVDYFYCVGNLCPAHRPTDYDYLNALRNPLQGDGLGNDHLYTAQCYDVDNGNETLVNASDLDFKWEWDKENPKSVISAVHTNTQEDLTQQQQYVTNSRNVGVGRVKVFIEGIGNKEKTNPVKGNSSASVTIYNNICSSPWPRAGNYEDEEHKWNFWYCRDQGETTTLDDLPALKEPVVPLYPVVIAGKGGGGQLLKEVVFPVVYYLASTPVTAAVIDNEPHIMEFTGKGKETKVIKNPTALAFTPNNFTDVPERESCIFASAQEATWKHEFIIPEDGSYQLYLQIFNYSGNKKKQANPANNDELFTLKAEIGAETIGTITPIADTRDQFAFFDLNYRKAGAYEITITSSDNGKETDLWEEHFALCRVGLSKQTKVNDITGVRVFKNPLHLLPKTWYQSGVCSDIKPENATIDDVCASDSYCAARKPKTSCIFNVPNRGALSELTIDNFPAVRSGRTVYVNAALQNGMDLFTNIYLFSYNENANTATIAIFEELLKNWKFTGGIDDKNDGWKKVRNDVRRAGDIANMKIALRDFFNKNGYYPLWDTVRKQLSGGTYIPGLSLSVWPSWKNTFEKSLAVPLPIDPVNDLKICPPLKCGAGSAGADNFCQVNPDTCWDETRLEFYCPPEERNVYGYRSKGNAYDIGTSYEYAKDYNWNGNLDTVLGNNCNNVSLGDEDGDGKKGDADNCDPRKDCRNPFDCSNPDQADKDDDGLGDKCDICEGKINDDDHDGLCGNDDNCPDRSNPDQKDSNSDFTGDACETACALDSDKDGECDAFDNCPFVYNSDQADTDGGSGPDCDQNKGGGQCYPPLVPRYCAPNSPNKAAIGLLCAQDYNPNLLPGLNCATDVSTPENSWNFCKTPDQIAGQVWPNGQDFGDACDPNTDPDNDGFTSGFCGGFTSNKREDIRLCQTDDDCEGFVIPAGRQAPYSATICRKLPASDTTRLDNCSYIKDLTASSNANTYAATYNIGQEDFDKDLVGYSCDTCIDSDNDKYTDGIVNEGFENELGGWTVVDGKLERSTNYRHLNEVLRKPSNQNDTSYRGVHAAWIRGGNKRMMLKQFLPGPARLSDIFSENRVWYTARAWVRTQGTGSIAMKVMRACTSNPKEKEPGIKFSARCHGAADFGLFKSSSSDTWALLEIDFYVNYESAQDGLVFVFDTKGDASAEYFIDDFQVFYKTFINRVTGESCARDDKKIDLCPNFSNPDVCVGGPYNGTICQKDSECQPKVAKSSAQGSVLGVEIKKVNASLKDLDIDTITLYEATKKTTTTPSGITPYIFKKDDPRILNQMPETDFSNKNNCDFLTGDKTDSECYDVYYSDSSGTQDSNGYHITIRANRTPPFKSDSNNIDAVELDFNDGTQMYGVEVTKVVTGVCDSAGCPDENRNNILGLHDGLSTALGDEKTSITIALGTKEETQFSPQKKEIVDGKCAAQADFDEDTLGDACDLCTDRDNDGYGDVGYTIRACPRSFRKTDNCPITFNPDQSDYDNDSAQCQLFGSLPYYTTNSSLECGNMSAFNPRLCSFCGGDACDLDADNDRCFNWEKLKEKNNQFDLAGGGSVGKILAQRGEGYLQTGKYDETNWLAFSGDTDHDGLPTDCDAQTCGNAILENVKQGESYVCEDFSIGARQCEECDVNDFGKNIQVKQMSYMISNFCASCNNLQCQVKTFRTCLPLTAVFDAEHANISQQELQKKENRTEFLWVLDNDSCKDSGNIRRIVALDKVDGRTIGYNYNNVIAPKGKGDDNKGDFDVFLGNTKTRVWVPFEDAGDCSGGGDEGIIQEIVENNYTLSDARACVIGVGGSGITLTAVDVRGNSWSYVNEDKDKDRILMQFAQDNAPNACPAKKEDHFYAIKNVGNSTHAIDIDSENNLWIVRNESIIKIDLDTIYEKFPNSTVFDLETTGKTLKNCLVKVIGSNENFSCVALKLIEDGKLGDIAFDAENNAWIARLGGDFGVFKVSPDNTHEQFSYNDAGKNFGEPTFLTVDIQNNLWIATSKYNGKPDNFVVKFDIKNSKATNIAINPDGTTLYGLAADSGGYVWAMTEFGDPAKIVRWKIENNQLDLNIYKTISRKESKRKRSLIRTGLTSKIIQLNSASSDYETLHISAVSSVTGGWSGSWGKVFYHVTPAQERDKILAEVSLGDFFNVGAHWISIEEFNRRIGNEPAITMEEYAQNKTLSGEIIGAYMKIRFQVPRSLQKTVKIDTIRVTCKDEAGRNVCQGGGNYKGAIIEPLPIAVGEEAGEAPQGNTSSCLWQGTDNPCNDRMVLRVGDVSVKKSTGSVAVPVFVRTSDIQCLFFGYNMEIRYDTRALEFSSLSPTDFLNTNLKNNTISFQNFISGVARVTVLPLNTGNTGVIFSEPVKLEAEKDYEIGLLNFTISSTAPLQTVGIVNENRCKNIFLLKVHGQATHPQLKSGSVKIE